MEGKSIKERGNNPNPVQLEITWTTILKVLAGVLLAFCAVKLWRVVQLLVLATLISVVLYRVVSFLCSKRWPRWVGILAATLILLLAIGGFFGLLVPAASREASVIISGLPHLQQQIVASLPKTGPVNDVAQHLLNFGDGADAQRMLGKGLSMAKTTLGGAIEGVVVFALIIYLMVDGPRAIQWWVAFFPHPRRPAVYAGLEEIGNRIVAYVTGQLIVSALFATYTAIVLSILKVPMSILLGVFAGMVDILPIIGILIALVPAALMALTVSPTTALIVVAAYLVYHGVEDYLIVPNVYGKALKISTLAVLLAMLIGAVLAGVLGAITALPLVAAYPCLERLWLARQLEPEVLKDHADLRAA